MLVDIAKALTVEILHVPNALKDDGTPDPTYGPKAYRWRLKMAVITSVTFLAVTALAANIYGLYGEGFANAGDLKQLRTSQLEERIEKFKTALCTNPGEQSFLELIRKYQDEYYGLTKRYYEAPSCDVLVKAKS